MPDQPIVPRSNNVPYTEGRNFLLGDFICRIIGTRRYLITRAKGWHMDPPRHYHTFDHALDVAAEVMLAGYDVFIEHPREMLLAALFHDAVYIAGAKDNEEKSARVALDEIEVLEIKDIDTERVAKLINNTSKHFTDVNLSDEEAIFMDADIHSFAAPWEIFVSTQENVAKEFYADDTEDAIRQAKLNQIKFLSFVLELPHIFYSKRGRRVHEATTRENIERFIGEAA